MNPLSLKNIAIAEKLIANEDAIVNELNAVQSSPIDIDGYYFADDKLVSEAMRSSATFNAALASV